MAFSFAPKQWIQCDGRVLNINDYQQLYSLIGITYGGNGTSNFAVPDLRGRCAIGQEQGVNLTPRTLGQKSGSEGTILSTAELPAQNHTLTEGNDWGVLNCKNATADSSIGSVNDFYRAGAGGELAVNRRHFWGRDDNHQPDSLAGKKKCKTLENISQIIQKFKNQKINSSLV